MSRVLPYNAKQWEIPLLLDGRKTVIRMVAKKIPVETRRIEPIQPFDGGNLEFECHWGGYMPDVPGFTDGATVVKPPYQLGDILYARETVWQKVGHYLDVDGETKPSWHKEFKYTATDEKPKTGWNHSWVKRPSIHMPKEAARIWLKVTNVRVERFQEIDAIGCLQEGIKSEYPYVLNGEEKLYAFSQLWNSTIKKSDLDRYGWDASPWVWIIEFERCEKPEEVRNE